MPLSPEDLDRHRRHILLKEIGGPGVGKLRNASVSIVGAGALGGPCALYLAAAGVGSITIWDDDRVERSNLQRQVQFSQSDVGALKAERLAERIKTLDSALDVTVMTERLTGGSALSGDLLIDASDNYPTRFVLNDHAHTTGRVLVSGAAEGWQGQVSVFASGVEDDAPCYRCLVPEAPPDAETCDTIGVVGAVTGMVGTRMALEAVKWITGAGETLVGRLWMVDGLSGRSRTATLHRDPQCQVCSGQTFL
ncbi:MAG: HesA/MoeB/ThiF family protein [Pseudomonadota bacterium]